MNCKTCKQKLKDLPQGFDALSFLTPITMRFCENSECKEFGCVTVAGIPDKPANKE